MTKLLCINFRGQSTSHRAAPFRQWYTNLGELKSLLLSSTRYAIFTATATKATKNTIFKMLNLSALSTYSIEKPPLRSNISFRFAYLHKEQPLETVFAFLIHELKAKRIDTDKCIIFCQTRKQCSLIYRMFQVALGSINFFNDSSDYENCLVQMFHAGSPDSVKTHIVKEMTKFNSHLCLLICTIAFGMGIDCKGVYRSIHFGPSTTVDNLVQETGRLGRDGKQCFCYILFNGLLMAHCDIKIKELVETECCRPQFIRQLFPGKAEDLQQLGCLCCDWCSKKCTCLDHEAIPGISFDSKSTIGEHEPQKRFVRKDQKEELEKKLFQYRESLLPSSTDEFIPVGSTGILFEFDYYQINQVLKNCDNIFNINDITDCVEVWRHEHANNTFKCMSEVFDDMDSSEFPLPLSEEEFEEMEVIDDDWELIRDDSSRAELFDNSKFEELSMMTNEDSQNESLAEFEPGNLSGLLAPITDVIDGMEI